jgi:protein TonB
VKRLLLAVIVAMGLHGLLFSMEPEWMKKSISYPLPTGPIALALTYKQPEKRITLPKKSAEIIQKVQVPTPKEEKKEQPKPEPPKKVKKPDQTQTPKPPKKPKTVAIEKKPQPEIAPEQISQPLNEPLADYEAFEMDHVESALPPKTAEEPFQVAALPSEADVTPEPPPSGIKEAIPLYRENPPPRYPRIARRKGYEGTVVLEALVNPEGKVADCRIIRSCGHSVLDQAAMKSIRNWLFEPGMRGEKKVEMWVKVPIRFQLK